jgi:predicted Zn-ribbon and HTH transcriptional regulator
MVTVTQVRMKCDECGHSYKATKTQGGFWNRLSYSPKRCPECNSKNVSESSLFFDAIGKFLGLY